VNAPQGHQGEHQRGEGLGGRVRRFVESELSRVRDKESQGARTDYPGEREPAGRGDVAERDYGSRPTHETSAPETLTPETPTPETPTPETPTPETPTPEARAFEAQRAHDTDQSRYAAPEDPHVGESDHVDQSATTASHDAGPTGERQPTAPEKFRGQSGDQLAADAGAARVGLLNDPSSLRNEWQQVQGTFVDDPQRAVREASMLVERTIEEIRANVGSERPSETMSTEDLRVSFQRYREFFQRLLAA
jgi:hypothetical protein